MTLFIHYLSEVSPFSNKILQSQFTPIREKLLLEIQGYSKMNDKQKLCRYDNPKSKFGFVPLTWFLTDKLINFTEKERIEEPCGTII